MTNSHLALDTDLPGALRRLNQPPGIPHPTITLRPCRSATALIDAAATWRHRCTVAGEEIMDHLGQLERFAAQLLTVDRHTAGVLGGQR